MDITPEHDSGGAPEPEMPHIHNYETVKFLGKGGFGSVFLAKGVTRSVCALKIIFKDRDGNNHAFDREYKSLEEYSALAGKPPSLLQILHVGTGDGFLYYTMPLADDISGAACDRDNPDTYRPKTLEHVIPGPGKAMPVREAITAVLPVLEALDFLHKAGRLHRDVKPANILIMGGRPVLGDIGLLTALQPDMTRYVSEGYSPSKGVTDEAGDLYSVGKVLLAAVGGTVNKPGVCLPTIQFEEPSDLFPALSKVIGKACTLKYKSARAMIKDLEKILGKSAKRKKSRKTAPPQAEPVPEPQSLALVQLPEPELALVAEGYRLLCKIGDSVRGRVWIAIAPGGGTRVLRIVDRCGDAAAFNRESDALKRLRELGKDCEFLASIDDVEIHKELGFISFTMPLAENAASGSSAYTAKTLAEVMGIRGRLPIQESVAVIKRLLGAVKALHSKGLIHRDIDPSHVFYVSGQPVLAGFGLLAKTGDDTPPVCPPSYVPPEVAGTEAGDLYAVAVLMYRLATGNPAEMFPSATATAADEASMRLVRFFKIAAEKVPSESYANAQAMEVALNRILECRAPDKTRAWTLLKFVDSIKYWMRSEPPGMALFKRHIRYVIESARLEAAARSEPERDYMTREEFSEAANSVSLAFERRLGHVPQSVKDACVGADAIMTNAATAKAKPNPALQFLEFVLDMVMGSGCAISIVFFGIFLFLVIRVMFVKMSLWTCSAIIVGISMLWIFSLPSTWRSLFADENPKDVADRATQVLLKSVDAAINELWGEYGDQLSV